ncbi:hypothetical protein B0T19DRAFT_84478 [Cercophora scortea]|uniref:Uncharacterized protein n=1 Tax=Cercophora scortea TaxID=314031 RepID=A0AAE0MH91_9PEZI|nr:hypothetical protein B0T19DRAFT_84478 [Cercophora scortea]
MSQKVITSLNSTRKSEVLRTTCFFQESASIMKPCESRNTTAPTQGTGATAPPPRDNAPSPPSPRTAEPKKDAAPPRDVSQGSNANINNKNKNNPNVAPPLALPVHVPPQEMPKTANQSTGQPLRDRNTNTAYAYPAHDLQHPQLKTDVPFNAQFMVLHALQTLLEGALYTFAKTVCPSIMARMGWHSPNAANLRAWAMVLTDLEYRRPNGEPLIPLELSAVYVVEILSAVEDIGRTVAQRTRVSISQMEKFARAAGALLEMIGMHSSSFADQVASIQRAIEATSKDLGDGWKKRNAQLRERMVQAKEEWTRLERKHSKLVDEIVDRHDLIRACAGEYLERAVLALSAGQSEDAREKSSVGSVASPLVDSDGSSGNSKTDDSETDDSETYSNDELVNGN